MKGAVYIALLCFLGVSWATPLASKSKVVGRDAKSVLIQGGEDPDPEVNAKREFVKQMLKDSWDDYVRFAWGENQLKPVSQRGEAGGIYGDSKIGATIVDALDTLFIAGLNEEYQKGRDWVAANLTFSGVDASVSVFETNIRFIGGFLTAYALTGDQLYVTKALEVATLLLPAFDTPSGIPYGYVNLKTGVPNRNGQSVLAEFGTLHLEFLYLSEVSGNPIFREKALKIRQVLKDADKPNGLYYNFMSPDTGKFTSDSVSIGAYGDSFYEYLLKAWIQLGDREARDLYDEAMNGFVNNDLVRVSRQSKLLYIAEENGGAVQDRVGHLACFAGGMFALGAYTDPAPSGSGNRDRDFEIGQNFTNTCHESYIRTATQIGPEVFHFTNETEAEGISAGDKRYILRPEVIESYFVLYRLTRDPKYRDWGWSAAQAIQKYSQAGPGRGFSGLSNVDSTNPVQDDSQQTFFLAETLKYLYLLFSNPGLISLDQWVFNTECHPLPVKGVNPLY